MTDKKALAEDIRNFLKSGDGLPMTDEDWETIVKALEQEAILDKITAEINAHKKELKTMAESDDWYAGKLRGHECDIEIIDKYRQEGLYGKVPNL